MKKSAYLLAAVVALILLPTSQVLAEEGSPWVHIRVTEHDGSQAKVSVNLPLSVVQVALDVAPEKIINNGRIRIDHHGHHDLSIADLRKMWKELRDSGDAEFVTVEETDERVVVTREGDYFKVDVTNNNDDKETVHVKIPITVVDALLEGDGEELNLRDALEELKDQRGEIVTVEGGDADVRIWIDERR